MIETSVTYVSPSTQRNVVRIDEIATSSGISDGRQGAEHEQQNQERADAAEQRLGEHARPARASLGLEDRVDAGQVRRHARRRVGGDRCAGLLDRQASTRKVASPVG